MLMGISEASTIVISSDSEEAFLGATDGRSDLETISHESRDGIQSEESDDHVTSRGGSAGLGKIAASGGPKPDSAPDATDRHHDEEIVDLVSESDGEEKKTPSRGRTKSRAEPLDLLLSTAPFWAATRLSGVPGLRQKLEQRLQRPYQVDQEDDVVVQGSSTPSEEPRGLEGAELSHLLAQLDQATDEKRVTDFENALER